MNEHRNIKPGFLITGILMFFIIFLFQVAVGKAGNFLSGLVDYKRIDPNDIFMGLTIHHAVQMFLTLGLIWLLARLLDVDFSLGIGDSRIGLRFLATFAAVFFAVALVYHFVIHLTGNLPIYDFPLTSGNILGTLCFQLFMSGPSEEILYRALPVTLFVFGFGRSIPVKDDVTLEIIAASLLFSIAHIQWSLAPFTFEVNSFQIIYAFVLGMIQGVAYQRSRSILYPMLMHSISNVLMVGMGYLFTLFL